MRTVLVHGDGHHRPMDAVDAAVLATVDGGTDSEAAVIHTVEADDAMVRAAIDRLVALGAIDRRGETLVVDRSVPFPGYDVVRVDTTESTNDLAMDQLDDAERVVVIADVQRAGRGRRGRRWESPAGGLWMSVGDARSLPAATAWLEPLAMAVAAADAVSNETATARVKWPNDVVNEADRKLGGVLVETRIAGDQRTRTVVGLGVNLAVDEADLPAGAANVAGGSTDRDTVSRRTLIGYERLRASPEALLDRWRARSATIGRRVRIQTADGVVEGRAIGIKAGGDLVVDTGGDRATIRPERCQRLRHL